MHYQERKYKKPSEKQEKELKKELRKGEFIDKLVYDFDLDVDKEPITATIGGKVWLLLSGISDKEAKKNE